MPVEPLSESRHDEALAFLRDRRETSCFLLGNLAEHGPALTGHMNAGNFNVEAQRMHEHLGFTRIGHYGLIVGRVS